MWIGKYLKFKQKWAYIMKYLMLPVKKQLTSLFVQKLPCFWGLWHDWVFKGYPWCKNGSRVDLKKIHEGLVLTATWCSRSQDSIRFTSIQGALSRNFSFCHEKMSLKHRTHWFNDTTTGNTKQNNYISLESYTVSVTFSFCSSYWNITYTFCSGNSDMVHNMHK